MDKVKSSASTSRRRKRNRKKKLSSKSQSDAASGSTDEKDLVSVENVLLTPVENSIDTGISGLTTDVCEIQDKIPVDCETRISINKHSPSVIETLVSQSFETLVGRHTAIDESTDLLQSKVKVLATSHNRGVHEKENVTDHCFSQLITESADILTNILPTGEKISVAEKLPENSCMSSTSANFVGSIPVSKTKMHQVKSKQADDGSVTVTNKQKVRETEKTSKEKTPEEIAAAKKRKEERKLEYQRSIAKADDEKTPDVKQDVNNEKKTKSELKAQRRALQEAQRAAKGLQNKSTSSDISEKSSKTKSKPEQVDETSKAILKPAELGDFPSSSALQKVQFFSHLQQYKENHLQFSPDVPFATVKMHPSVVQLGLQYAEGTIVGSNARCVALLHVLIQVIDSYVTPPKKELSRDLEDHINSCISYLQACRPLSVSMENAVKFLKRHITQMPSQLPDAKAKEELKRLTHGYIEENIKLADQAIANYARMKINNTGDEILTFGHSSVIAAVLIAAQKEGKKVHVTVVDSQPSMEGKKMVSTLVKNDIKCSYALISSLSYTMQKATKVFLGAHALLANGYVMSRVGSSQVALVAKAYNVPVLICCETYKFSDRVQTDSFVYNELRNPDDLRQKCNYQKDHLQDWKNVQSLNLLNLAYDVTPPELVSVVVTELGMLPCTSVPVVLRVKHPKGTA